MGLNKEPVKTSLGILLQRFSLSTYLCRYYCPKFLIPPLLPHCYKRLNIKCINNWYIVETLKWRNECLYLTVINILTFALKWADFLIRKLQFLESAGLVEWMPNNLIGKVTQTISRRSSRNIASFIHVHCSCLIQYLFQRTIQFSVVRTAKLLSSLVHTWVTDCRKILWTFLQERMFTN